MQANSVEEADLLVSILNAILEKKGYNIDEEGFGYNPETLEVKGMDDSMEDMLSWVWEDIILPWYNSL